MMASFPFSIAVIIDEIGLTNIFYLGPKCLWLKWYNFPSVSLLCLWDAVVILFGKK